MRTISIAAAVALLALTTAPSMGGEPAALRIGYQKAAAPLVLLRAQAAAGDDAFTADLAALGYAAEWKVFESGPPLLEALRAGSLDVGYTGAPPPIFAQAGGADIVYLAVTPPNAYGRAIVVPAGSPLSTVRDLAGKRIGLQKGSSAQYLLVRALEAQGLSYGDVAPVYLSPSDARPAFAAGRLDAWVIWDPYLADAEARGDARVLLDGRTAGLESHRGFYLAGRAFAEHRGAAIDVLLDHIRAAGVEIERAPQAIAARLASDTGIDVGSWQLALRRSHFGAQPLDEAVFAEQQSIADTFFQLGLIPVRVQVRDAAWRRP